MKHNHPYKTQKFSWLCYSESLKYNPRTVVTCNMLDVVTNKKSTTEGFISSGGHHLLLLLFFLLLIVGEND